MENIQKTLSPSPSLFSSSSSNPDPPLIDAELWLMAEKIAQEIICTIQPNVASEYRRKEVILFVSKVINAHFQTEVFSFGSVPLKTYLPDGDIDLTALTNQSVDENLARKLCNALRDEHNSEFHVKDVRYIEAQVKIIKCIVKNIPVDISFNQFAGLFTLCFLEQIDELIGKDHLFKRSIILIKAWCYYQSRMLGAHHGLISTYALETMVLYIINRFHASVRGPLEVLYTFLEYYSRFDWDTFCVTISGPIAISSLTEITETAGDDENELLLSGKFLSNYQYMFSGPTREDENRVQEFPIKHLNILDPLNENNNLGRSVNKGSFYRIIGAFAYGAQKLREIFTLPGESIGESLEKFFETTLDRNGRGERPDVQVPVPAFGTGRFEESDLRGDYNNYYSGLVYGQCYLRSFFMQPNPAEVWNNYLLNAPTQLVQNNWNVLYQSGANFFPHTIPFCYPDLPQLPAVNLNMEKQGRSRGTGTYIPNMALQSHHARDRYQKGTKRSPNVRRYDYLPKSAQGNDPIGVPPENNDGSSSSLALQEFPLHALIQNPIPSDVHHSDQLAAITLPVSQSSPTFGNIDFGTYRGPSPPLGLSTNVAIKQADSYDLAQKVDLVDVAPESGGAQNNSNFNFTPESDGAQNNSNFNFTPESDGAQNNSNFNFSLEEFPLLTRSTLVIPQSDQLAAKNSPVKHFLPAFGFANNDAGTRGDSSSLLKRTSMASRKQADASDQYLSESTPSVCGKGILSQEESSDGEKETSLIQTFQLEDDQDFPPLMSQTSSRG